jgi:tRNA (guanosine-2'-O-)-methyltransferase
MNSELSLLTEKIGTHINENRKALIERVLHHRTRHFTVAVENIYHPHNVNAVLRSCECFGLQDLYIIDELEKYKIQKRIAKGANKWIDLHFYEKGENPTLDCIQHLKANGYIIVGTSPHKHDIDLENFDYTQKAAFFFGAEKEGISKTVKQHADCFVKIPIYGFTESFNVSVAVAIILHHLTLKMRKDSALNWQLPSEEIELKTLEWYVKSARNGKKLLQYYKDQLAQTI